MNEDDLPPHLRESDRDRPAPTLQLPLELPPELHEFPPPQPEERDDRPVDPFLRNG